MKLSSWACVVMATAILSAPATASELLDEYAASASASDPGFDGFSAKRGEAFFAATHGTGKPDTPACTSCHTTDPKKNGRTRAGKTIAPLAKSLSPERYTDRKKVEKWFRRNCKSVLGRSCSAIEKGDFIIFMSTQ